MRSNPLPLLTVALLACGLAALVARRYAAVWLAAGLAAVAAAALAWRGFQAAPAAAALVASGALGLRYGRLPASAPAIPGTVPDVPVGLGGDGGVALGVLVLLCLLSLGWWRWRTGPWAWFGAGAAGLAAVIVALGFVVRPVASLLLAGALSWTAMELLAALSGRALLVSAAAVWLAGWALAGLRRDESVALAGGWGAVVASVAAMPLKGMAARLLGWGALFGLPVLYLVVGLLLLRRADLERSEA